MEFRVLGPVELAGADGVVEVPAGKPRALLALLLVERGRVVSADALVDRLWGERPPATAAKIVQGYVSRLRRLLPEGLLETRTPGYLLRVADEELDLARFESLRREAAASPPEVAAERLAEALALWRGPALADVRDEPALAVAAARLDELRLVAVEERVDAELAVGRHVQLVPELEALVAEQPLRERLRAQLMLALYRSGRQADALAAYRRARGLLRDELGLDPGVELQELERRILAHDPALGGAGASGRLPSGTVTFLFTDVEGSTRLLERLGAEAFAEALEAHRRVVRAAVAAHHGVEVDTQGDSFFVAFPTAPAALAAAAEVQTGLADAPVRVRMGLHTGTPHLADARYYGVDVHRAARIAAAAHGGQVVLSSATASLVGPDGLRDLGEHRFKDLAAPERVFQLGTGEFPPLKSLYRTNLPIVANPLLGRANELAEVVALLRRDDVRLVTMTGPGGTGKTRLSVEAAATAADAFPAGVTWVALAPLTDPAFVVTTLAQALDVAEEPGRLLLDSIASRIAGSQRLLLLDNAEHLLPAIAETVGRLRDAGGVTLLVTSRERLAIAGEHAWPVPPFEPDEGVDFFVARARALDPAFEPSSAVAELCERLDNLPLTLELAAARTVVFSPEQLLERLGRRLDLFKGPRDAESRHRTLRATIAWSHDLLDAAEQRLFARLSVFAGGCTFEAAEAVCDADAETLQSLLDKSLVRRRATEDEPRYWMLETIHDFARERLVESGERDAVRLRLIDWVHAFATAAEPGWRQVDGQRWNVPFRLELDNVRQALTAAFELGLPDQALEIATLLSWLWWENGPHAEGREWVARGLAAARRPLDAGLEGYALHTMAVLHPGGFDEPVMRRGLELTLAGGRLDVHVVSTYMLAGTVAHRDPDAAEVLLEVLEAGVEALDDPMLNLTPLGLRGQIALVRGDLETARPLMERYAEEIGEWRSFIKVGALGGLVAIEVLSGDLAQARELYAQMRAISLRDGLPIQLAGAWNGSAAVEALAGEVEAAEAFLAEARGFAQAVDQPWGRAEILLVEAALAARRGEVGTALEAWSRACAANDQWDEIYRALIERDLEPLRAQLPEDEFRRAWERGSRAVAPAHT